ncbi:MAG: hypothetical protein K0B02_02435 [DPANN group archaeon]|nr:hypothetical protein [DPANN group archaeon]
MHFKDLSGRITERRFVVNLAYNIVKYFSFDCVAGVVAGSVPFATSLSDRLGLPLLSVRGVSKDYVKNDSVIGLNKSYISEG